MRQTTLSECKSWTARAGIKMTSSFRNTDLPHSSVVLLSNTSKAKTERKKEKEKSEGKTRPGDFRGSRRGEHRPLTRHLSIHLIGYVWCWRPTADHTFRGHVVTMGWLRRRSTLVHPSRAHGHVLSGRLREPKIC